MRRTVAGARRAPGDRRTHASVSSPRHSRPRDGETRGCVPPCASSRHGRPCHGTGGRRRSPAAPADGRTGPASHARCAVRTAPAPASRDCALAAQATPTAACCSPPDAAVHTGGGSPTRPSGLGLDTSAPRPRTPPGQAMSRDDARRTTASVRSWAAHRENGAPASTAGTEPRARGRPDRRSPRIESPLVPPHPSDWCTSRHIMDWRG